VQLAFVITVLIGLVIISLQVKQTNERIKLMAATQADLDAAIAALPAALDTALETALAPIIAAIQAKAGAVDFTPEITSLNAIPASVSAAVAMAVTPAP
jgi:predicted PurR-regulated permease PerM